MTYLRRFRCGCLQNLIKVCVLSTAWILNGFNGTASEIDQGRIVGMYVHQHWPYNHPYAARTWTIKDWQGYADGLKRLGYNSILIWPVLETMPDPLTASDRANIRKIAQVIDLLHEEFGMRVYIVLCPNVIAQDEVASKMPFPKRHFFYCDRR